MNIVLVWALFILPNAAGELPFEAIFPNAAACTTSLETAKKDPALAGAYITCKPIKLVTPANGKSV